MQISVMIGDNRMVVKMRAENKEDFEFKVYQLQSDCIKGNTC